MHVMMKIRNVKNLQPVNIRRIKKEHYQLHYESIFG
jgi:hypothetical protein